MRMRTINEAAEALGVTGYRLRQGIQSGRYPSLKLGRRRLVDLDALAPIVEADDFFDSIVPVQDLMGLPR